MKFSQIYQSFSDEFIRDNEKFSKIHRMISRDSQMRRYGREIVILRADEYGREYN